MAGQAGRRSSKARPAALRARRLGGRSPGRTSAGRGRSRPRRPHNPPSSPKGRRHRRRRRRSPWRQRSVALSTRCPRSSDGSRRRAAARMAEAEATGACAKVAGERSFIGKSSRERERVRPDQRSLLPAGPDPSRHPSPSSHQGQSPEWGETASAGSSPKDQGPVPAARREVPSSCALKITGAYFAVDSPRTGSSSVRILSKDEIGMILKPPPVEGTVGLRVLRADRGLSVVPHEPDELASSRGDREMEALCKLDRLSARQEVMRQFTSSRSPRCTVTWIDM